MNTNTSNSYKFRSMDSQNSFDSERREGVSSSNYREVQQRANIIQGQGINGDGGTDYNLVYRTFTFPDQISFEELVQRKEVLQQLLRQFKDKDGRVIFEPYKKDEYSKRLLLLQQQIDGIMRQTMAYSGKGRDGSVRSIDYLSLINQKQNQVIQLERKICNLEAQLRIRDQRERELQAELQRRFALIKVKNDEIERLKNSAKSYTDGGKSQSQVVNSHIKNLINKLDELSRRGCSVVQMETEVEGWILGLPADSELKRKLRSADQKWLEEKYKRYVSFLATEASGILNYIVKVYTAQIDMLKSKGIQVDYDNKIIEAVGKDIIPRTIMPSQQVIMSSQVINSKIGANIGSITNIVNSTSSSFGQNYLINGVRTVVQVPVQDIRTKALIHRLATEMRRLYTKYPKLATEISPELSQYFSQEIIDVIEVDELDRLVQIVKYKPDIVKVENVYAYSSEKSRKVQFHLRVLIKALLEEMERIKLKTGVQPEIDQGVIGMIRQQVMDLVDVDDILKVYRVVPKIVEVEKVVEQVVEKIVPVPHFVTVQQRRNDIIPVNRNEIRFDTVIAQVQVPKVHTLVQQKLVKASQYEERVLVSKALQQNVIQTVTQVPTVRATDKVIYVQKQVPKDIVEVPGPEKFIELNQQVIKEVVVQKIIPVQKIIRQIVEVPQICQKVVTIFQQIPKIIEVQKIIQKIVYVKQYIENLKVQNHVVEKFVEVDRVVEKVVPVQRIIEKVVTVPQIVEKIVPLIQKQQVVKVIQIFKEVPVYMPKILEVQKKQQIAVPGPVVEKPIEVDRIVQVGVIHQKVIINTQYVKEPVVEREQKIIRQPVKVEVPVVLFQEKIVQVVKPEIHQRVEERPVTLVEQQIVPVQTVRQQLIPAPYIVQKVIQKIVEVPRIVEIEKIVEKIVPVPRVIEKIVEVQKIVEKIVEKVIYQTKIQPIKYEKQVPITVQSIVKVQVPQYIIQRVEVPHFIDRENVIINEHKIETVRVQQIKQTPRILKERIEVPFELVIQKPVPFMVQDQVFQKLQIDKIVPVQIPVPQLIVEQKFEEVKRIIPIIHEVDRARDVIVQVKAQLPGEVKVVKQIQQKIKIQKEIKVVNNENFYEVEKYKQIEKRVDVIVPVNQIINKVVQVPIIVEKIVGQIIEIPNIVQVQKNNPIPLEKQKLITVQKVVPKIITLNKAFGKIVDKLHEIPRLVQQIERINIHSQVVVPQEKVSKEVVQAEIKVEKAVCQQKIKEVEKFIHVVNESLKIAEIIIEKPTAPLIVTEQKILEVPVIVQKLAERIVIMPQIVEVLKYVHEITDNESLGIALTGEVGIEQAQYQRLGKSVNNELTKLRALLVDLRNNPQFKNYIVIIDSFLAEFNKFLSYPRIREIMTEKIVQSVVEKDKIVKVPTKSSDDERRGLASAVLIDKLLMELRRLRMASPNTQFKFDPDLVQIFGDLLEPISNKFGNNYNQLLEEYSKSIFARFNMYGTWTLDHQRMLKQFIEERFQLANRLKKSTKDSLKYKQLYTGVIEKYNREKIYNEETRIKFTDIQKQVNEILGAILDIGIRRALEEKLNILHQAIFGYASGADTTTFQLKQISDLDKQRVNRYVREKDLLIAELRITIESLKKQLELKQSQTQGKFVYGNCNIHDLMIKNMQNQLDDLKRERQGYGGASGPSIRTATSGEQKGISQGDQRQLQAELTRIRSELSRSKQQVTRLQTQLRRLRQIEIQHRGCAGRIRDLQEKLRNTIVQTQKYQKELYQLRSVKQTKRTIGSVNTPQREAMSDSYGTNYMEYVDGESSGVRNSKAEFYDKGVFRSGGNYGPIGSNEMNSFGNSTGSVSGGIARGVTSTSGAVSMGGGGMVTTSGAVLNSGANVGLSGSGGLSGSISATNYVQQRSTNYLSESRGSGISAVSGLSRGQISNKSSKAGGATYNYQQTYQRQDSKKGSNLQSSQLSQQRLVMNESSGQSSSSRFYGTSVKQTITKTWEQKE